ncbi:hypothetical protein KFL_000840240 [Klebsormidium nitens]|uniref:gamma-glutamylcyclotransferase n=1 Tax=Klebsormidium nitens TaxID=105231 RepID=A0A1Y1HUT1_KLENI|nr:hypothetical protein KFL_000840240 [Klebsormidium nitens]|eukprot:GAQ81582.1 hypothetical protein KFL_000840240 [Klebsormidium nitens]
MKAPVPNTLNALFPPLSRPPPDKPLPIDPSERPAICQEEYVHNFAFGSNMGPEKVKARAGGIEFVSAEPGLVRDYRLAFNLGGVPPIEPVMAGIEPEQGSVIHGTLIKLPRAQYEKLYKSEGGGAGKKRAYLEEEVTVETYSGKQVQAVAFRTAPRIALPRHLEVPASKRYLDLLVEGAKAIGLDKDYVRRLEELPRAPPANGIEKWISRSFAMFFFFWAVRQLPGMSAVYFVKLVAFFVYHYREVCRQSTSPALQLLAYPLLFIMLLIMLPGSFIGVGIRLARTCSSYVDKGWKRIKVVVPEREAKELK